MNNKFSISIYDKDNIETWRTYLDDFKQSLNEMDKLSFPSDGHAVITREADGFVCLDTRHDEWLTQYEMLSADEYDSGLRPESYDIKTKRPSVYFDIDGTAAYWYKDGRGLSYPEEILDPKNHYYRDLEPHQFIVDLAKALHDEGIDVCILSATDRCCVSDRWEWIDTYMPFIPKENIFLCPVGANKNEFCKGNSEISVLIDDYEKNLGEWTGRAVKSINSINSPSNEHNNIFTYVAETAEEDYRKHLLQKAVKSIKKDLVLLNKQTVIER